MTNLDRLMRGIALRGREFRFWTVVTLSCCGGDIVRRMSGDWQVHTRGCGR